VSTSLRLGEPIPQRLADLADEHAPMVPWRSFYALLERGSDGFRQGQHVTIISPTNGGKTTLAREVVKLRSYVLAFFSKPKDPLVDELVRDDGYRVAREVDIRVEDGRVLDRRVALSPRFTRGTMKERRARQAGVFRKAFEYAYDAGGWCVWLDDALWLLRHLGLAEDAEMVWFHGRTSDISLVTLAQRPRHLPLAAYSQVEHLWLGHTGDREDIRRLGEIGAAGPVDTELVRWIVTRLERWQFLYVQPHSGVLLRVKVDL
jgi:hypothetical protein